MSDDFGMTPADVEVAMYALRTFMVHGREMGSIVQGASHWQRGVCVARCTVNPDPEHVAPAEKCSCGIYGFFSVDELLSQYREYARYNVAVIAVEGMTTVGTKGLKTAAARVVAYWCCDTERKMLDICQQDWPDARRYYDRGVMTRIYGLDGETPRERE